MRKPSLILHIIFHPASAEARGLARTIHKALNADPAVPGLRVPTVFCPTDGISPPASYDLGEAERSLVLVLADAHVVDGDSGQERTWSRFIGDLWAACQGTPHRFLPVQLHPAAWGFDERLTGTNFIRAFAEPDKESRDALVVRRLVIELCRELRDWDSLQEPNLHAKGPVSLFLSHTKLDIDVEPRVTTALIDYLKHDQPVRAWVDAGDIDAGSPFAEAIERGVEDSSLLCVLTDNYSTREWCRKEIILAKQHQRPVVVVAAFSRQEVRSFPYLGNVPVLRWPCIHPEYERGGEGGHQSSRGDGGRGPAAQGDPAHPARDPAARAAPHRRATGSRPVRRSCCLFCAPREPTRCSTPTRPWVERSWSSSARPRFRPPRPSPGSPPSGPSRGPRSPCPCPRAPTSSASDSTSMHLRDAMVELSRYLLLKGATLVYGGHLGDEGYTQALFELVRAHHCLEGMERVERIVNTVGWPLPYNQDLVASYNNVARLKRIPRPADLNACPGKAIADAVEANPYPADQSSEHRYCWARGMTQMREAQVARDSGIAARIILGGKLGPPETGPGADETWYAGRIPGVLEEVALSAKAGQPVFLIGAFGGAAALAIDLLEGKDRPEASWDYQRRAPHSEAMRALYDRCGQTWLDYSEIMNLLRTTGPAGINPLLSEHENRELLHTRNITRMIELILTGLGNLGTRTC